MKLRLAIYILSIMLLTLAAAWSFMHSLYFTGIAVILVILGFGFAIWRMISRQIGQLEQIVKSLQAGDLNLRLRPAYHDSRLEQLATELDEGVQSLHRQMSENKAKVQLYADRLDQAETQAWQKLIRVLTHEIMNSITPVISLSETLLSRADTADSATIKQGLGVINRRSKGLMDFVQSYRQLTKVSTPVLTDIPVMDILTDLRGLYPDTSIHFSASDPELVVRADRPQLEQVLINLIKNAIEATAVQRETGNCRIELEIKDLKNKCIGITVSDNGPGIAPDVQERIFIPFFTTKQQGSGIGLALCRQIVLLHGGQISVQSKPGQGTAFHIVLPA